MAIVARFDPPRKESPMPKLIASETEFYVGSPPMDCDLCHHAVGPSFVDGKTMSGPWANMCTPCHSAFGVGLGAGKGQCYQLQASGKWAKMVPAAAAKRATKRPSMRTLERWSMDGVAKATDGCTVEPDGVCSHGAKSWLLAMGLV